MLECVSKTNWCAGAVVGAIRLIELSRLWCLKVIFMSVCVRIFIVFMIIIISSRFCFLTSGVTTVDNGYFAFFHNHYCYKQVTRNLTSSVPFIRGFNPPHWSGWPPHCWLKILVWEGRLWPLRPHFGSSNALVIHHTFMVLRASEQ